MTLGVEESSCGAVEPGVLSDWSPQPSWLLALIVVMAPSVRGLLHSFYNKLPFITLRLRSKIGAVVPQHINFLPGYFAYTDRENRQSTLNCWCDGCTTS